MKNLVNEFRDYARLPAAQLKPLDLNALVARGAAPVRQRAGARPAALRAGAGLPRIMGDGSQLRQVIHNLVQNALDAVPTRRRARAVRTEARAPSRAACARCGCR
jgi:nitrogen fixation/metabolism regulation signal transduction histidine kinase